MKKDENRFTIRFNTVDPRQRITRDALEAAGRRKALLITDAICEYLARHGGDGAVVNIPIVPFLPVVANGTLAPSFNSADSVNISNTDDAANANTINATNTSNIEGVINQTSSDSFGEIDNDSGNDDTNNAANTPSIDNDMREAILGGLSAFKI